MFFLSNFYIFLFVCLLYYGKITISTEKWTEKNGINVCFKSGFSLLFLLWQEDLLRVRYQSYVGA